METGGLQMRDMPLYIWGKVGHPSSYRRGRSTNLSETPECVQHSHHRTGIKLQTRRRHSMAVLQTETPAQVPCQTGKWLLGPEFDTHTMV